MLSWQYKELQVMMMLMMTIMMMMTMQASKLCLSRDGRLGMLSSRRHLVLLDLEEPEEILRKVMIMMMMIRMRMRKDDNDNYDKVGRSSRWEVAGAQWNPHSQLWSHVSVCSNDKVEVWVWGTAGECSLEASVRASTRQRQLQYQHDDDDEDD